ncbi:hypothetical protein A8F94_14505 [Bacillus sp. FJAT-27225]|uniref:hypothetical protein n=1 Tax=Bacillus sp. FJAT-27225 TaxID=1743144 RepID=UPI00080C305F|nr:hypothetical protein [Bacillus sp. FJAT-27225]OCA86049.1 hypothetical protein A8F94_14505 [Bacillus sp. FJAT-27225]
MKFSKILFFIIFIIIFTPLIFLTLDIYNITKYIPLSKTYDWLGFYGGFLGSTLGGAVTFLGVYLTLKSQNNLEHEKNRLSVIPILEYRISYDKADFDNSNGQLAGEVIPHININNASYQDENSIEWYFNLIISNVGIGHAQISGIKFKFLDANNHDILLQEENIGYSYKLVKKDHEKSFKFLIYAPATKDNPESLYALNLIIEYNDLLGNVYEQLIHASISSSDGINSVHLSYYENYELKMNNIKSFKLV